MGPLEQRLVDFALSVDFDTLPERAVTAAKARLIDSVGVGFAAYLAPPVRVARAVAQPTAGPMKARIWGTMTPTTPDMAGFVNGVMVRYLDLNDAYRTKDAHHPSDYLPGVLALAEAVDASGKDFIAALAVSYEIACRFTDAVPWNTAGWDQPVSGAMGTALAAGRLLGLDREAMGHALSLAVIPNLCTYQTRAGELSMWKGCAGPNGARNGLFAAMLAAEGMTGPDQAFDGVFGAWNQTLGGDKHDIALPDGSPDWLWGLIQTNIKVYPVRDSCQLPIDTALDLRDWIAGRPIEALSIETYKSAWEGAVKDKELWAPQTRETADHSMIFSVAAALVDGKITPDTFESGRFLDDDVLDLIGRTEVDVLDDFTAATPQIRNCRITARLAGGEQESAHKVVTLEDIARGLPMETIEAKFRTCTARAFSPERQDAVLKAAHGIDGADTVRDFIDLLYV